MYVHQAASPDDQAKPAWLFQATRDDARQIADQCERRRPIPEDPFAVTDTAYQNRWHRWRTTGPGADAEFTRIINEES